MIAPKQANAVHAVHEQKHKVSGATYRESVSGETIALPAECTARFSLRFTVYGKTIAKVEWPRISVWQQYGVDMEGCRCKV